MIGTILRAYTTLFFFRETKKVDTFHTQKLEKFFSLKAYLPRHYTFMV